METFKNYIYMMSYQVFYLITPLITIPYITKALGTEAIGINSFSTSITAYFILMAGLGINTYAIREIARVRDNKEKLSEKFYNIFLAKIITSIASIVMFVIFIILYGQYKIVFTIQLINILAIALDISWFFSGVEEFKKPVIRGFLGRLLNIVLILIFVKNSSDIYKYVIINSTCEFLSQAFLWITIKEYINKFIGIDKNAITDIIKMGIQFFIPQLAIQLYSNIDKTMIGVLSSIEEVAVYDMSQKIVKIGLTAVSTISVILSPKLSNIFVNKSIGIMKDYLEKCYGYMMFMALGVVFGIISISNNLVPWFLGSEFLDSSFLIIISAPLSLLIVIANFLANQVLIPMGKEKVYTKAVLAGSLINFIANMILITRLNSRGAIIASTISQLIVVLIEYIYIKKEFSIKLINREVLKYFISAIFMFLIVNSMNINLEVNALSTLIQVFAGIFVYLITLILLKSKITKDIYNIGISKILRGTKNV